MSENEKQARQRVENTPELKSESDMIFSDWPNWEEHMAWIATAPISEILDWASA